MELQHLYVDVANGPTVLWKDMKGNNNQNKYATLMGLICPKDI